MTAPTTRCSSTSSGSGCSIPGSGGNGPDDQVGLAFTYYQVSPSLTRTESLEQQFGLPPTYPFGVQSHAMVLEANYNIPVYPGIQVQPEFEHFFRPGGVSSVRNALVLGLKTHVLF